MRSDILFLTIATLLAFAQCQGPDEPYVEEDDALDAASNAPKLQNGQYQPEKEPKYPDGVNTIPGSAERDYPTYEKIIKTSFSCANLQTGFYADVEARCQVWHICDERKNQQSFLCPNGTIYSQEKRVCDWWYNVICQLDYVERNYHVNDDLFQIPGSSQNKNNREGNERPTARSNSENQESPIKVKLQAQVAQPQSQRSNFNQQQPQNNPFQIQPRQQIQPSSQSQRPTVALAHFDRHSIIEFLNNMENKDDGLTDEERFPLKYKLIRQREDEAIRLKMVEDNKKAARAKSRAEAQAQGIPQLPPIRAQTKSIPQSTPIRGQAQSIPQSQTIRAQAQTIPQSPPIRVVGVDQKQSQPAIIRLTNQFGVNPPKTQPQRPENQARIQGQVTSGSQAPTPRPNSPPPPPPVPLTPVNYNNRPRQSENFVKPEQEQERRFEGTDESKFPQQQARQFPSLNSGNSNQIRIQDSPANLEDGRNTNQFQNVESTQSPNRLNNQQEQRRFQGDVNADGKRFQNGESRQQRPQNDGRYHHQEPRQHQQPQRPQQQPERRALNPENRGQGNRYQNKEEPAATNRPQNLDRGQQRHTQQQPQNGQSRNENNFRDDSTQQPQQQQQRRPRPKNEEPPPEYKRPIQEERQNPVERPQPESRFRDSEPLIPPRNAVRDSPIKEPENERPLVFASPETHRSKFRHSTPRRVANVQFAPASAARDAEEKDKHISEESVVHPVPSFYNNRYPIIPEFQIVKPAERVISVPKYRAPVRAPISTIAPIIPVKYPSRPTPMPETVETLATIPGGPDQRNHKSSGPTIVRIIVKQKPKPQPEINRRVSEDDSLDLREEEEFIEAARNFGGRYRL